MTDPITHRLATETLANASMALLSEQTADGFWVGELSSSALSTATAAFTLSRQGGGKYSSLIRGGLKWLADHQNADGGWGDTVKSFSNLSTTCLGWAALYIPEAGEFRSTAERAEAWIRRHVGTLEPKPLSKAVAARYGKDRTFSVPILTMLALAGRVPWAVVPQLPFELAALPFSFFQVLQLPVVSYALPALIAIGQVKHAQWPTWNPLTRLARWLATKRTLRKLRQIQPTTGGYLEATPLTSFVCMSLIGAGKRDHEVVEHGLEFLAQSVRADGSWPIDTNLTTWVTTLAVNAISTSRDQQGAG
ncbi:MAG: squalene--hopene cyclase, partial [Fimbriiglobus sp.]|nr:squalene--hopene cyclase [Fimbriiglobus sp.]